MNRFKFLDKVRNELQFTDAIRKSTTLKALEQTFNDEKLSIDVKLGRIQDIMAQHAISSVKWKGAL